MVIALLAAVVGSQTIIIRTFSIIKQCSALGCLVVCLDFAGRIVIGLYGQVVAKIVGMPWYPVLSTTLRSYLPKKTCILECLNKENLLLFSSWKFGMFSIFLS